MPAVHSRKLIKGTTLTLLVGTVLGGCASGPPPRSSKVTRSPVTQATKRASSALYDWQKGYRCIAGPWRRCHQHAVERGGARARREVVDSGHSVHYEWPVRGHRLDLARRHQVVKNQPPNAGRGGPTTADAATNWGTEQIVVGSAGPGDARRAAVWVSPGPGRAFVPVADSPAFDAPLTDGAAGQAGAVMDTVTAGALGAFAAGSVDGKPTLWYSTDGRVWQVLSDADSVVNQAPGAVVNDLLTTPAGVFAGGSYATGTGVSGALWYSADGIHWATVRDSVTSSFGLGDQFITSLVAIGPVATAGIGGIGGISGVGATASTGSATGTGSAGPQSGVQSGLLAVGGVRTGSTWQPASWISPNGSSWSQTSESFPLDAEPPESSGALAYAAAGTGVHMFAVGGSPGHQRFWQSTDGLAWTEVALPAAAADDADWHLGLVAADQDATVLADNLPGQPYVLVRREGAWYQPNADGAFGQPLPTAVPTSLVDDNGALVMSVRLSRPSLTMGRGTTSVAVLTSTDGRSWRAVNDGAFHDATVNQLLAVPGGLMAVGSAPPSGPEASALGGETGAFASLSANDGATWPREPITPDSLGGPGPAAAVEGLAVEGLAGRDWRRRDCGAGATSAEGVATAAGTVATTPLTGPFTATAAGRLGNSEYVIGDAGRQAVGWYSPDGTTWEAPQPLDPSPQLSTESPLATCSAGSSAVVVGTTTSTAPGSMPAAWVSSDGSSWTSATFSSSSLPPAGLFNLGRRVPIHRQRLHRVWGDDGQRYGRTAGPLELEQRRHVATIARLVQRWGQRT